MAKTIRILTVEDQPDDAALILYEIRRSFIDAVVECSADEVAFRQHLVGGADLILADFAMPGFGALRVLDIVTDGGYNVPVVVVTGTIGEASAVECMRRGAADVIFKDRLWTLGATLSQVLEGVRIREEKRQLQATLAESETRFRMITELTSDCAYALRTRPDGVLAREWSVGTLDHCPTSDAESIPQLGGWLQRAHPDDRDLIEQHYAKLQGGAASETEFRIMTPNGTIRHVRDHARAVPDESGYLVYGSAKDVTEWKQIGSALRASEERYRRIVETAKEAIIVIEPGGAISFVNGRTTDLVGYTEDELIGMAVTNLLHQQDRQLIEVKARDRQNGLSEQYDLRVRHKDGSSVWVIISASPLMEGGEYTGTLVMLTDITERKHAEDELMQAQKLESVGRLAAGIAHEINTPIQFIGDNVHFLQDRFASLEKLVLAQQRLREAVDTALVDKDVMADLLEAEEDADMEYLVTEVPKAIEQTLEGVERVASIVKAMKEFAHPDQGEFAAVNLNHALQSTLTVARNELKYVAEVETEFGDLPTVVCALGAINQVFLNLLINAAHAIADRPRTGAEKGIIRIETSRDGEQVVVSITDNGCGIPEAIRARVFDQFFTTKPVGRGTGQGLALARRVLVEQHGGSLTFESEVGRGTTFFVRLPVDRHFQSDAA
jgi:two-component system NtrC family sensor kinase